MGDVSYLNENDVVAAVCDYLESHGYTIHSTCTTKQTGEDIVASNASTGERLSVEAKGATSARERSARFGQPFDSAQIRVHVSEAVFKAVQVLSAATEGEPVTAGIALPATSYHQSMVGLVMPILERLGVRLFWVLSDGSVTTGSPPPPS